MDIKMNNSINTVLGQIAKNEIHNVLSHEHILCAYAPLLNAVKGRYLDERALEDASAAILTELREKYELDLFVDCTPLNLGRDIDLMKRISEKSGVNIVCSTGFYYTEEPILYAMSAEALAEYMVIDAEQNCVGAIKAAVERPELSSFDQKLLRASSIAQKRLGIPLILHTNAANQNGRSALELLLEFGVEPECITVGHLSDAADVSYVKEIAKYGCYLGFDRLYGNMSREYIDKKLYDIKCICDAGFEDRLLLSHDEQIFNGFDAQPGIKRSTRYGYVFESILPRLEPKLSERLIHENPIRMLLCEK